MKFTVAPRTKLAPFTVSVSAPLPATTEAGLSEVITGAVTVKLPGLLPIPPEVVMLNGPVWAPAGTTSPVSCVPAAFTPKPLLLTTLPVLPLKVTLVAPVRLVPSTVSTVPMGPLVGVKLVMTGAFRQGVTVTLFDRYRLPLTVATAW